MAQRKEPENCETPPSGETAKTPPPPASDSGTTPPATSTTGDAPSATQILQTSWGGAIDTQTAQQFTGLSQVRMARVNQLQREAASLAKTYGPTDPGVLAVQASVTYQQTFGSRLGVVSTTTSTTAPTAPANGWVVYGRVRNADLTPAPQLTVFLADEARVWLKRYAYAFTDQTGYFTLTYTPVSSRKVRQAEAVAPEALSAYLEVSNASCKLMYLDTSPMSLATGAAVYRDIVLSAEVPLGSPPCEQGSSASTPPAKK
jgi:hypothetical protein